MQFGAKVVLTNLDTDDEVTYQIVGADEANIDEGRAVHIGSVGQSFDRT